MTSAENIARILAETQRDYLTHRDRYGGRPLPMVQAEAVLAGLPGTGGYTPPVALPAAARRLFLLQLLIEAACEKPPPGAGPADWPGLVHMACGYGGYGGYPPAAEAEYTAMAGVPLPGLLAPDPAGPRMVWPYCPHPHAERQPRRLQRSGSGWVCTGKDPQGGPCGYETGPAGQPVSTGLEQGSRM